MRKVGSFFLPSAIPTSELDRVNVLMPGLGLFVGMMEDLKLQPFVSSIDTTYLGIKRDLNPKSPFFGPNHQDCHAIDIAFARNDVTKNKLMRPTKLNRMILFPLLMLNLYSKVLKPAFSVFIESDHLHIDINHEIKSVFINTRIRTNDPLYPFINSEDYENVFNPFQQNKTRNIDARKLAEIFNA